MQDELSGYRDNRACPAYRYPSEPRPHVVAEFEALRRRSFEAFLQLSRDVLAHVPNRPDVANWPSDIGRWVTGFPSGARLFEGDTSPRAVVIAMWTGSVEPCT